MNTSTAAHSQGRRRTLLITASAVLAVVLVATATLIVVRQRDDSPPAAVSVTPVSTPSPTPTPTEPTASPTPTTEQIAPGDIVVEAGPDGIDLYDAAGDDEATGQLGPWTALGAPTTLLGFDRINIDDESWIQVELPEAPNHRTAWVREAAVTVTSTTARIDIYLDERELDLSVDGEIELTNPVVIGAPESPTPEGVFWVTDPLDFSTNPSGVYGAFALGLNGWSETLDEFNGGPPQLAIHGTNQPELLGEDVSNGCIRLPNDVVTEVADIATVGTPVVVHQSRTA